MNNEMCVKVKGREERESLSIWSIKAFLGALFVLCR